MTTPSLTDLKTTATAPKDLVAKNEFQKYTSSRQAVRLITDNGFRITFTDHTFLTQNEGAIEYLDREIAKGLRSITKGDVLTTEDLDPMAVLRKKFFAEFQEKQAKERADAANGIFPDMGTTAGASTVKPASSATVAK